ncbi:MAG: CcoQ/FixQ family Cbb3-type cytochrome c oxidase assembly chaperone [Neisseriaceae bacterium]|nr:CcoQ/FixQ family Cbb3-type cytochrome c oxidase assembly chaperone [Neisseriaceae bacterium]
MDINWARSLFTVGVFVSFVLILFIVLNKRNKQNYQDVAQSIIDDPDAPPGSEVQFNHEDGAK